MRRGTNGRTRHTAPLPPLKERFERIEETLQIVGRMWSAADGLFMGRHG
jgi:hypothetical protein